VQSVVQPPPGISSSSRTWSRPSQHWADTIAGAGRRHRRDPGLSASGSAPGLHKRGDNPVYRARVLEVRIHLPPAESQQTFGSWATVEPRQPGFYRKSSAVFRGPTS